jgi:hypothetical protein
MWGFLVKSGNLDAFSVGGDEPRRSGVYVTSVFGNVEMVRWGVGSNSAVKWGAGV